METKKWRIVEDIRQAQTLPADFYRSREAFLKAGEKILARTWHFAADSSVVAAPGMTYPFTLLEGVLDEPMVLTRDRQNNVHCLSNVCTHRGKVVVEKGGRHRQLTCGYHGRCFGLDGTFRRMPGFHEVRNFPTQADDLAQIPVEKWLEMLFIALEPAVSLEEMTRPIRDRVGFLPLDTLRFDPNSSKDYDINAHWVLYCDNYLEGFHIPFVHPALNQALDFDQYDYELFPYCNLQVGIADDGEPTFDLPDGHPDAGRRIYAYYFFLFPNLMFNFYPWGLSLNVVEPLSPDKTRVRFRTYRFADTLFDRERNQLDQTEMEDEAVVESCQRGIRSRFYHRGRYAPQMERCVHHFHRLIDRFLEE